MARLSQRNWVLITIIGFLAFVSFFYITINSNQKRELSPSNYFFLIVAIDLVATGFLFGAMKSFASLESKSIGTTVSLAGPAAMFVIILYIGYEYRPIKHEELALTVYLTDLDDEDNFLYPINASLSTNRTTFDGDINKTGTVRFNGIPGNLKGQKFQISLEVPGYHLESSNRFNFNEVENITAIDIGLKKNVLKTTIFGQLINSSTKKGISGATIHFDGTGVSIITNTNGFFSANLPIKSGTEIRVIAQKSDSELYSSLRTINQNNYLLLAAD